MRAIPNSAFCCDVFFHAVTGFNYAAEGNVPFYMSNKTYINPESLN